MSECMVKWSLLGRESHNNANRLANQVAENMRENFGTIEEFTTSANTQVPSSMHRKSAPRQS